MRLSGYGASNDIVITDEPPEADVQFPNAAGALATQGMGAQPSIPRPFLEMAGPTGLESVAEISRCFATVRNPSLALSLTRKRCF
jgi:hypothetical protein